MNEDLDLLSLERFPRSSRYDPAWVVENEMGPNALWLTEFLCEAMDLRPRMRVLDLGCGKALSSIFLAREFDLQVWATDLWVSPTENAERTRDAGLDGQVLPIGADARDLPSPDGYTLIWNCYPTGGQEIPHVHLHVIPRFADEPYGGRGGRWHIKQPENRRPDPTREGGGIAVGRDGSRR